MHENKRKYNKIEKTDTQRKKKNLSQVKTQ